jgi:DNA polymerase-3 subunit epsilon
MQGGDRSSIQSRSRPKPGDLVPSTTQFDPDHPFFERTVVFTETLESMSRAEAMQAVVDVGGVCGTGVTRRTDYLVTGDPYFRIFRDGQWRSGKLAKAESLIAAGYTIEIIPESEFLALLLG